MQVQRHVHIYVQIHITYYTLHTAHKPPAVASKLKSVGNVMKLFLSRQANGSKISKISKISR